MPRRAVPLAERLRRHREAFALALDLGCTPAEAEAELARRAARARWIEARDRLEAKRNRRPTRPAPQLTPEPAQPWWARD